MKKIFLYSVLAYSFTSAVFAGSANYKLLDEDRDGWIQPEEAKAMPVLVDQWTEMDVNEDNRIDAVEFSRFESLSAPPGVPTDEMGIEAGSSTDGEKLKARDMY